MHILSRFNTAAKVLIIICSVLSAALLFGTTNAYAQDYNCGAYGTGAYGTQEGEDACQEDLENTGQYVMTGVAVGGVFIAAGVISFVVTYRRHKKPGIV